jgi:hypothetical protein
MPNFSDNTFTDAVKAYLCNKHGFVYSGRFILRTPEDDESTCYSLQWLENNQDRPYVVMGDFENSDDFLQYVYDDIDSGRFFLKQVFTLKRTDKEGRT